MNGVFCAETIKPPITKLSECSAQWKKGLSGNAAGSTATDACRAVPRRETYDRERRRQSLSTACERGAYA